MTPVTAAVSVKAPAFWKLSQSFWLLLYSSPRSPLRNVGRRAVEHMNVFVLNAPQGAVLTAKMSMILQRSANGDPPAVDGRSRWRLQVLVFHFNWLCDKLRSVCTFAMLATGGGVMVASALNLASNDVRGETRQNPGCFTSALDEEAQTVYSHPFYWSQWLDDKTWS